MLRPSDILTIGKGLWAIGDLWRHPDRVIERLDYITDLTAVCFPKQLESLRIKFSEHEQGRTALRERRRLHCDVDMMARLPPGTLGREFVDHMIKQKIDPKEFSAGGDRVPLPHQAHAEEIQFIRSHIYWVHDVWHVILGFDADLAGEFGVIGFYSAQSPYAVYNIFISIAAFHIGVMAPERCEEIMTAISSGYQMGLRAKPLFGVDWAPMWGKTIEEVRRVYNVQPFQYWQDRALVAA